MIKEKILLIDGWNILISQNSTVNILNYNAEPIGMFLGTANQIKNFVEKFKPTKVFFVLDGPNAGERRRKMYFNYKGKRRVTARKSKVVFKDKETNETDTYEIDNAFEKQLKKLYDFLKHLPVTVCIIPYLEADDVITYLALMNKEQYDCIIVSTDKDYLQHIDEQIFVYNWHTKTLFNKELFFEKHKILSENYIYKKIIRGDSSDEISNIKGIGEKTFEEVFSYLKTTKINSIGDFFDSLDNIDSNTIAKKHLKHIVNLQSEETKKEILLKYKLMKLEINNLQLHHINLLKVQVEEQESKTLSKFTTKILMGKEEFNKLYSGEYAGKFNADNWLQPFVFIKPNVKVNV